MISFPHWEKIVSLYLLQFSQMGEGDKMVSVAFGLFIGFSLSNLLEDWDKDSHPLQVKDQKP